MIYENQGTEENIATDIALPIQTKGKRGAPFGNKRGMGNRGGHPPSKYHPNLVGIVRKACERGLTDTEIADLLGVSEATLHRWKLEHPAFGRAWKLGKGVAHDRVERSLYERAIGYDYDEEKQVMTRTGVQTLKNRVHVPPDVRAAIFYLINRRPERWKSVHKVEHSRTDEFQHIEDPAELRALLIQRAQALGLITAPIVSPTPEQTAPVTADRPPRPS